MKGGRWQADKGEVTKDKIRLPGPVTFGMMWLDDAPNALATVQLQLCPTTGNTNGAVFPAVWDISKIKRAVTVVVQGFWSRERNTT